MTSRREIASVVARESAETLFGATAGARAAVARGLLGPASHVIARRFVQYDRILGETGPRRGSEWIVRRATSGVIAEGAEHVPSRGPVLVVANHPGLADAVSLLATMRRDDAWIVTADYPFLRALRRASERFLFVDARCTTLRRIVRRLRAGQAVLLFPAGALEPDPARAPADARAALDLWSRSIELIPRLVPGVCVVPALVSGAVSARAYASPLARRRMPARERQRMASLVQLAIPAYRGALRVSFGEPARPGPGLYDRVVETMRALMDAAATSSRAPREASR